MSEFTPFEELVERERQRQEATRLAAQKNFAQRQRENDVKRRVRERGEQDKQDRIEYYTGFLQEEGLKVASSASKARIRKDVFGFLRIIPIGWVIDRDFRMRDMSSYPCDQRSLPTTRYLSLTALKTDGTLMEAFEDVPERSDFGFDPERLAVGRASRKLSAVEVEFPGEVELYRDKLAAFVIKNGLILG